MHYFHTEVRRSVSGGPPKMCSILIDSEKIPKQSSMQKAPTIPIERKDSIIEGYLKNVHFSYREERNFITEGNVQQKTFISPVER